MGEIISKVIHHYPNGLGHDITSTRQKDWITKHAKLSRFSIVEVERLWARFKQIGCDETGVLHKNYLSQSPRFKEDVLMRNMLLAMVDGDKVYFHTFLNAMYWVNNATVDEKSKAIFSFFNNGNPMGKELFTKILRRIYPDKDDETISRYVKIVFDGVSNKAGGRPGEMSYENFLRLCHRIPQEQLTSLLDFDVIPADINEESKQRFAPQWRSKSEVSASKDLSDQAMVSFESFHDLSVALTSSPDWENVMRALGFSDTQIDRVHSKYSDKSVKIRTLLKAWKDLQEEDATCGVMRSALRTVNPELVQLVYGVNGTP